MKIKPTLCVLFLSVIGSSVSAQSLPNDDLEMIARRDVKTFKLTEADLKLFRRGKSHRTSDYFKPTLSNVSDPALLKDSTYVKMYRNFAYSKTSNRKGAGEYMIIAGAIVVLAGISALITL